MQIDLVEFKEYLSTCGPATKIYIGADSERFATREKIPGQKKLGKRIWFADYMLVAVVHRDSRHGCKIFGEIQRERDYDAKASKPSTRLMNEAYKVAEFYERLKDVIDPFHLDVQIHLDLNPSETEVSNIVIQQAVGYIRAACNVIPLVKPDAFAASYCADRLKHVLANRSNAA